MLVTPTHQIIELIYVEYENSFNFPLKVGHLVTETIVELSKFVDFKEGVYFRYVADRLSLIRVS